MSTIPIRQDPAPSFALRRAHRAVPQLHYGPSPRGRSPRASCSWGIIYPAPFLARVELRIATSSVATPREVRSTPPTRLTVPSLRTLLLSLHRMQDSFWFLTRDRLTGRA